MADIHEHIVRMRSLLNVFCTILLSPFSFPFPCPFPFSFPFSLPFPFMVSAVWLCLQLAFVFPFHCISATHFINLQFSSISILPYYTFEIKRSIDSHFPIPIFPQKKTGKNQSLTIGNCIKYTGTVIASLTRLFFWAIYQFIAKHKYIFKYFPFTSYFRCPIQ